MSPQSPRDAVGDPGTPPTAPEAVCGATSGHHGAPERLRRAADLIEQRAASATPAPWTARDGDETWSLHGGEWGQIQIAKAPKTGTPYAEYWPTHGDSAWITTMSPQIAEPLAALLRECAAHSDVVGFCNEREALALADVILNGEEG